MRRALARPLATLLTVLAVGACGGSLPLEWRTYEAPSGWAVTYPGPWHLQEFHRTCTRAGSWIGVVITNLERPIEPMAAGEGSCNNSWELRGLPRSTIVVEIRRDATTFGSGGPEANFPLRLEWAEQVMDVSSGDGRLVGSIQPRLFLPFEYRGHGFTLNTWIASEASAGDKERLQALIRSIDFSGYRARP